MDLSWFMEGKMMQPGHNQHMAYGKTARGASSPATKGEVMNLNHKKASRALTAGFAHARTVVNNLGE
jgi:hypothetical protein